MYFDSHVHTAASPDSQMEPEDAIAALKKLGLGVAFTEHVDFSIPDEADSPRGVGDFICDFDIYPAMYEKFRGDSVAIGVELGLTRSCCEKNRALAAGDFDFVVGSVHAVDGVELFHAITGKVREEDFMRLLRNTPGECVRRYLDYALEMVRLCDFIDAFGHLDYIARYHPALTAAFSYGNFPGEIDALLGEMVRRDVALEINTYLFGGVAEAVMPEICRRYAQLGGRRCTIGSDAHEVAQLARHFGAARRMAEETGLAVVHYKGRTPHRCG